MRQVWLVAVAAALGVLTRTADAHKPITSPFTFSADVQPILRERCGRCHAPGRVAPMSLLTHADAVPWGESMRGELIAGHMPPWSVDRGAARFRDPGDLTARELNVLLTWLTGGTPPGAATTGAEDAPGEPGWTLGLPDAEVALPSFTLGADEQERVAEFVLPGTTLARSLRAIDLLPGTPAIVRSATIAVQGGHAAPGNERMLSLWVPGDAPAPLAGGALKVPAGSKVVVRVRYRKTWEYERKEMADRSRLGLYTAPDDASAVRAVPLSPAAPVTLARAARAIAVYPDATLADAAVVVTATRPDGRRIELIAFHPRREWTRRYWFREPVALPRGTRLSVRVTPDSPLLLPPGFTRPAAASPSSPRVTVNVM